MNRSAHLITMATILAIDNNYNYLAAKNYSLETLIKAEAKRKRKQLKRIKDITHE